MQASRAMVSWTLVLVVTVIGSVAAEPAAQTPQLSEGQVWAVPLALPWDEQAAKAGSRQECRSYAEVLNRKLDLSRKGKVGDSHWYEFRRENVQYDRLGRPVNRMVAQGRIKRTLQREEEPGWWRERLEWRSFSTAQTQTATEAPAAQEIPGARGIGYDFSPKHFDFVNIPADFSPTGNEIVGYLMKVASMDVSGFDAIVMGVRDAFGDAVQIGQTQRMPRWQQSMGIERVTRPGEAGRYQLGELIISAGGITRRNGEPCLLVWFSADGNEVKQDVSNEQMTMRLHGTEYFRGEMAVSLLDGRVVSGELFGPLPWVMELGMGGQPVKEQPVAGVIQQVSLWEVPGEPSTP